MENECGSRIITTTRNLEVAKQAGSVYQMEPLSLTDSTKLFCQRIFGSDFQKKEFLAVKTNVLQII
jgi:hypothetical protein